MSLAGKLVDAAEEALGDAYRPEGFGFSEEARAAVVSALKLFAEHLDANLSGKYSWLVDGIADVISELEDVIEELEGDR